MGKKKSKEDDRALTPAEERRVKEYEAIKESFAGEGYQEKELTIGIVFANIMAVVLGIPLVILFGILFFAQHADEYIVVSLKDLLIVMVAYLVLIVAHEVIHGITWAIFAKGSFKTIEFGFIAKYVTPYCCCKEPLRRIHYIPGALMPTILLGIVPIIIAIMNGSFNLFLIGSLMIFGGGGDLTVVLKILLYRGTGSQKLYLDHPYKCGTIIFEK